MCFNTINGKNQGVAVRNTLIYCGFILLIRSTDNLGLLLCL